MGHFVSMGLGTFLLLSLSVAVGLEAQAKRPESLRAMTFEDMMQMRRLGDTDVSPDGKWLVYSVTDVDLAKNTKTATLWIQAIEGGQSKRLAGTEPGDGGARFSHDGKQILFLSSRSGKQQIYVSAFDPERGNIHPDDHRQLTTIATEADNARWSPDGKSIVFTSSVYPDCPAIKAKSNQDEDGQTAGDTCNAARDEAQAASKVKARIFDHLLYKHWNAFTGDKRSHLFLLDMESGSTRDLTPNDPHDVPPFSLGGDGGFAFSPDSKELAFTENLDEEPAISTNADIFTLDLTNPAAKPVKVSTSPGGDFNPAYSPDGKYLAWRSQARAGYESDKFRLMLYDRATKTAKDLLPKFDRWVDEFAWASDSRAMALVGADKGESPLSVVNLTGQIAELKHDGEYSDLHSLPGGNGWVASVMTISEPGEVTGFRFQGDPFCSGECGGVGFLSLSGGAQKITHLNDVRLRQLDLSALGSFWYQAKDDSQVQGFLIKPPAFDPAKKYPVKFLIHGGPQGAWGDAWSYRWNAELLAANGYVVIMINPRGSTGYGQAFVDGVNGDWGGKPFTDLMLGLDYAEQHYPFIDKDRECALGASYGGYMANWILGHTNRFKCIVTHDGMFNPESAYGSTEELWFNEWEFKGRPWDYYGKPDDSGVPTDRSSSVGRENPYRKWSPALYAKNFKTPTLVIHSQLDYRLDVSEGYQLFTTLQRLHVPSKMLYFPDEGHWVQKPQNSQLWYKTVNAWVDQWIGQWTKP